MLIRDDLIGDTIIAMIEQYRPIYSTLIDRYYEGRTINVFLGKRPSIPRSSLPSIEVEIVGSTEGWHACRTQQDEPRVDIQITQDNTNQEAAVRLQAQLVTLTASLLSQPAALRTRIANTRTWLFDSLPRGVTYSRNEGSQIRQATINWSGKYIVHLPNIQFDPALRVSPQPAFPPV